ncbi:uncharacterized protein [Coffea arabica]|uniref:Uncharacterized protein isoform X1 n=1 Tax=Coffea arabica TaxID=13443 RepID=A0A6P6V2N2_COFAR|nr:LRR receptor-like serine/threonine-protein kinase GSO1 isoform X1 [Coffea arabica]
MRKSILFHPEKMGSKEVLVLLIILMITKGECKASDGEKTCHPNDLKALIDFKSGIRHDDSFRLEKWIGRDCCKWDGIVCDNVTGRVIKMKLPGAMTIDDAPAQTSMDGVLSPSLSLLTSLEVLELSGLSHLEGQIPPLIGNLAKLRTLALSYNGLSGPIPESIGKLSKLEEVHLNSNNFSGSLPSSLGNLSSLGTMDLTSNHFSGSIPHSIGNLMNLVNLYLENNVLTGYIPKCIGNLQALQDLKLSNNLLTGGIPFSIGKLSSLRSILLDNNHLTGRIPSSFGQLKSLVTLSLQNNQLEGPVRSNLGQLQSLAELNLGGNRLSGKLPKTIGLLPLFTLSISNNMIEGPLPVEMSSLTNLSRLYLSFNPLNLSSIPTWLVDMPSINAIHLAGCGIEGEIPRYLQSAASRWAELDLSANHLTGSIPSWLGSFHLQHLNLSTNSLSSEIPATFISFEGLEELDLHSNKLSGSLNWLFQMRCSFPFGLSYVDISNNRFRGDIELIGKGSQQRITNLNLSNNLLKGELPKSIGELGWLWSLDLSYNQLNSVLPESLANASLLERLNLQQSNLLSGEIPQGKPLTGFPKSSYSGNRGLCGAPLPPCKRTQTSHP